MGNKRLPHACLVDVCINKIASTSERLLLNALQCSPNKCSNFCVRLHSFPQLASSSYHALKPRRLCRLTSLEGLPEELTFAIFEAVLSKGRLTPRLLELFLQTEHESVLQRIKALQIEWVPPVLPTTRNLWLHERPGFY
jgi:hypothetical protein